LPSHASFNGLHPMKWLFREVPVLHYSQVDSEPAPTKPIIFCRSQTLGNGHDQQTKIRRVVPAIESHKTRG
jgi:hypothetical protein